MVIPSTRASDPVPAVSLRDRTRLTQLMILRELHERPGRSLTDIARALSVTVQAVSAHVKRLEQEGLTTRVDGAPAPTGAGLQALTEGFRELKRAVDEAVQSLAEIHVTSARATEPITRGERVALFMAHGELCARTAPALARAHEKDAPPARAEAPARGGSPPVRSASRKGARVGAPSGAIGAPGNRNGSSGDSLGRALSHAASGDEVIVGDLEGVVALTPGRVMVVRVPSPGEGGSAAVDRTRLLRELPWNDMARVAAHGTGARVLAASAGREPDMVFAPARAAFHAAELGLDVMLLSAGDLLEDDLRILEKLNATTLNRIVIHVVEAPLLG